MALHTPASLMWLIRKQTRIAGEIERQIEKKAKLRAEIADCDRLVRGLRQDLAQLEAVMGMHEVQVEPNALRPIRPHRHKAVLTYGGITKVALDRIRLSETKTASTRDIVRAVIGLLSGTPPPAEIVRIKKRVRVRLSIMAQQGMIAKLPHSGPCDPRSWRLSSGSCEERP